MIDLTWRNTAGRAVKYYRMDIVQGLFGDWSLVHEWGKFGEEGQSRMDWFQTEAEAKEVESRKWWKFSGGVLRAF